jgi:3',5'-nucleoside bisphosphate phosphatase
LEHRLTGFEIEPLSPDAAVDLHMHTLASDGGWTPETLVEHLAGHDFKVVAVADHDTMASVPEMIERGMARGIKVVPAVEMTTRWRERQIHLLIYGMESSRPEAKPFMDLLERQQEALVEMSERILALLEKNGRKIRSMEEVLDGRPQKPYMVYRAMIKDGHGTDARTAHNIVKGMDEPGLVDVPFSETVEKAQAAGAVAVIAHPGRDDGWGVLKVNDLTALHAEVPFDGLEAHYRSYTVNDTRLYRGWADEHELVVSTGSDSHRPNFPVNPMPYKAAWSMQLLRRLGIEVEQPEGAIWDPTPAATLSRV